MRNRFFWVRAALVLALGWLAAGARGAEPAPARALRVGPAVVTLPAAWRDHGPEVPVWLHLHGAPDTTAGAFAGLGSPGILITVTLPGLSKVYADFFAEPGRLGRLLDETAAAIRAEAPGPEWTFGPLTVSAFSAGFGGVRALLRAAADFERIGTLVMADSIYCGYAGDPAARQVDPALMAGFLRFAEAAAEGKKRFVLTHSEQVPEGYASTTETADYLLANLGGTRAPETQEWNHGLRQRSAFSRGRLDILGFAGAAPEDHLRHLRGIGDFWERALPVVPARAAATIAELQRQLAAHTGHPRYARSLWGVKVVSLDTGAVIFERGAEQLLSPASNSKLYAGALALDRLGGDYRIATPIFAAAAPDAAGRISGDVIVAGRGDPSWKSGPQRDRFGTIFDPFVAVLQRAGVRRIEGDVVADATYFRGPAQGAGWTADDLTYYYGAEISAITLEENYVDVKLAPGAAAGEPAAVALLQPESGLTLDNRTVTTPAGSTRRFEVFRLIGEDTVRVFGEIPLGTTPVTEEVSVPVPARWFARGLKSALVRAGIEVGGAARAVTWPAASPVPAAAVRLGEIQSPPLRDLVTALMKPSQNLETDLLFAYVGERARPADAPAWRTSEQLGVAELRAFTARLGLPAGDVRFEEGSGLSRNNLTTARATAALLAEMARHREAEAFRASLPVAGVDGSLRRRMRGTEAQGNVQAKTGTLRWANSLSGYVTTAAGERLAFAVLLNRHVVPPGRSARDDVDAIPVLLARCAGRTEAPRAAVP